MTLNPRIILDTSGLICPEPVMLLHNAVRDVEEGDLIEVIATDPSTQRDIPKFCEFLGHQLLTVEDRDQKFFYYVKKGSGKGEPTEE